MAGKSQPKRCEWCLGHDIYVDYHDKEWGKPVHDERTLFEFLTLESMQAGLSWLTVLRKRENFRKAFANFDPVKVQRFSAKKVESLMQDAGIIRNRLKIESAINNAKQFLKVQKEFGSFAEYSWDFIGGKPIVNRWRKLDQIPATTPLAEAFSKDLKARGFKFMGPTVVYAHMQATGMVMDHTRSCFRYKELS